MMRNTKLLYGVLFLICIFAFVLRLYRFDNPVADWHSWRQTDTSAVSRSFVQNGFDLLHPRFEDLSNIPSGVDNLEGYRFVEFPIYNVLQASGYMIFGYFNLEQWGRIVTILASVSICISIFLILRKYLDSWSGIIGAFFYAALPFSIYFGRTLLPDTLMIASAFIGIYFFGLWIDTTSRKKYAVVFSTAAVFFSAVALLLKPYAIFFFLPMIALSYQEWGWTFLKKWKLWVMIVVAMVPLVLWRAWMTQFPAGIPASNWLFNGGNIRFKGAFFYWIFGERISKLILGYVGIFFALLGMLKIKKEKNYLFFLSFVVSSLLYVTVIARGNVQHDYYQILIVPSLVLFMARGVRQLFDLTREQHRVVPFAMTAFLVFLMISLSWYHVRDFFNINNGVIIEAGKRADQILPQDAKVIAPLQGDTTLLYYTNRAGWPAFQDAASELAKKGATHIVLVNPVPQDFIDYPLKYTVVASSSSYMIVKIK